eukprot:XP_025014434.1 putative pentatricopeptide repeat-containing protein At1g09680 isoform X2 [Ricinus communis]
MSAKLRLVGDSLKVQYPFCLLNNTLNYQQSLHSKSKSLPFSSLIYLPKTLSPCFLGAHSYHSQPSNSQSFDYFYQFSPFCHSNSNYLSSLNSNERRILVVELSKLIKQGKGYILKSFSQKFCPFFLVKIMKLLESRQSAFAFFKLAFQNDSDATVHSCCIAAHILAAESLQLLAQDVISWVIRRIGASRSAHLVEFMWANHHKYESDFSILNTLMRGFMNSEMAYESLEILSRMREVGVRPSSSAISILFRLLLRVGDYGSVWKLLRGNYKYGKEADSYELFRDWSLSSLVPDCSLYDVSVAGLCWAGQLDEAMQFLEDMLEKGMPPSVVAFNSVIAAYSRAGFEDNAHKAYKIMLMFGLVPSSSTCSSMLLGLSKKGRLQEARDLLYKMIDKGLPVNKVAFTVLLDGYFKVGDTAGAHSLWYEMEARGICPDAIAFSAFIDGLSKAGLVEEAYEAFSEMSKKGFVPNNFVYNSLIHGLCNCGKLHEALKLEREMRQKGLLPDIFTTNIIINGFCKEGRMKSAFDAFAEMHHIGVTPDTVTYNTLIGGYCKVLDMVSADEFLNKMYASGWDPDITTYNIRIQGFCSSQKISRAVTMLDELIAVGVVPNTVTYNTMMNAVCTDMLDRAMVLTAKLLKMAFVPNVVTTNVLLSHFCKQGMPEKALIWGQKLSEISFDFDEISYKIMDRAYIKIQNNSEVFRATSEKSLFLDFLMYITYDFFQTASKKTSQDPVKLIENGYS